MSLFQSNLRKQIRNLPKILQFVKIIHYYSELFTSLLTFCAAAAAAAASAWTRAASAAPRARSAVLVKVPLTLSIANDKVVKIVKTSTSNNSLSAVSFPEGLLSFFNISSNVVPIFSGISQKSGNRRDSSNFAENFRNFCRTSEDFG